ncbi:uncharacterized protein TNCV_2295261 [Trichonephila clavipes]|nr:uncharacterized protein TNCV_2295261 [Trichonephila clavipes]
MVDSEHWRDVGRIETGQSITDVALFFGVHHSVISRLWKQFQTTQTVAQRWSPKGYNLHGRSIYCYCSQAESQSDLHTCDIYGYSVRWQDYIGSYCKLKITYEWTVFPGTLSLCSSIHSIKRSTI